jgi:predicted phosphatase
MTKKELLKKIKANLKEARNKGWWITCFYWERKLELEQEKK